MGDVVNRGTRDRPRYYMRWVAGYRPAVNSDGSIKTYKSGPKMGQPKVDAQGHPLLEPIRRNRAAKGATTATEARRMVSEIERNLTHGKIGIVEQTQEEHQRATLTIRELGARFVAEYADPDIKDLVAYREDAKSIFAKRINPFLGALRVSEVELSHVETMRDQLTDAGYMGGSVMIALATLSRMYTWAHRKKIITAQNPTRGCKRPRSKRTQIDAEEYLDPQGIGRLLDHAESNAPSLYPMILTALLTGLRKGELLGLRWRDIDFVAARMDVTRSYGKLPKSGKPRHVPMHPELGPVLKDWQSRCPASDEGLVFPTRGGRMGRREDVFGLDRLMVASGCKPQPHCWHQLRHTFASRFMMDGGNILELQKLLGHSDIKMTMTYAHLAADHLAAAVARLKTYRSSAGVTDLGDERRDRVAAQMDTIGTQERTRKPPNS